MITPRAQHRPSGRIGRTGDGEIRRQQRIAKAGIMKGPASRRRGRDATSSSNRALNTMDVYQSTRAHRVIGARSSGRRTSRRSAVCVVMARCA